MPETISQTIAHGTQLTRCAMGTADELGAPAFLEEPIHQMYAQHPFPSYQAGRKLTYWHMDHPELDRLTALKIANLQDYDTIKDGCQTAVGLQWPDPPESKGIEIGVSPANWQPDYTGPARPLTEQARRNARKAYSHEEGHRYFWKSRVWKNEDDISRLLTQRFQELRPRQGHNEYEDGAEVFRALLGADECRGYYSNDQPATNISPELRSLVRCLYWLSANLRGAWVASLVPKPGWVWFQVYANGGWRWRAVNELDWHQQEWTGAAWVRI